MCGYVLSCSLEMFSSFYMITLDYTTRFHKVERTKYSGLFFFFFPFLLFFFFFFLFFSRDGTFFLKIYTFPTSSEKLHVMNCHFTGPEPLVVHT
jgi:hypothetical protein